MHAFTRLLVCLDCGHLAEKEERFLFFLSLSFHFQHVTVPHVTTRAEVRLTLSALTHLTSTINKPLSWVWQSVGHKSRGGKKKT